MADTECYVDVLLAADALEDLSDQDDEPTEEEWNSANDALADAVHALREFEASEGTSARDEPWGGTRAAMVEVLDAADAWYTLSYRDDGPEDDEADAVLDRLGAATRALRVAEGERDAEILRGEHGEVLQRVLRDRSN